MIKVAFIEDTEVKVSLEKVFFDLGVKQKKLRQVKELLEASEEGYKIFIAACDFNYLLIGDAPEIIKEFVSRKGIFWIMRQGRDGMDMSWLPPHLAQLQLENRHVDYLDVTTGERAYVGPWIMEREHPIWNKPNQIDESHFVFWQVKVPNNENKTSTLIKSCSTHIIYQKGWDVLAGFADDKIKFKDKAALVMEAKYGKGLYFWTEIFPPQLIWEKKNTLEKETWRLFIENIFIYFKDFKEKSVPLRINIGKPHPERRTISGLKAYKFLTHTHYQMTWQPVSLGILFGVCKGLGIDAVVLAQGQFHQVNDLYQEIKGQEIKAVDSHYVRFFPGQEIHCHHRYGLKDGVPRGNPDGRRHATTIGVYNLRHNQYSWDLSLLENIHKKNGIAIVAHPYMDPWWMNSQKGHNFDAIEFDRTDVRNWDKMLKQGEFIPGVSGVDNLGPIETMFFRGANIGWFNEPLTLKTLMKTIIEGRITKVSWEPFSIEAKDNYLWFDINNQIVGGILYAVDFIRLNIKAKIHLPIHLLRIVKNGNRDYKKLKPGRKSLKLNVKEKVTGDSYYRLEMSTTEDYPPYNVPSLTNPIFIRKVKGPQYAYFYIRNDASPIFNDNKKRWQPNFTRVGKVKFSNNIWNIVLYEPGDNGKLYMGWEEAARVKINGRRDFLTKDESGEKVVNLRKGLQKITIFGKRER